MAPKKKTCEVTTIEWKILISKPGAISEKKIRIFFLCFACSQGLDEMRSSKPLPSLSLPFDFSCVTTIHGF